MAQPAETHTLVDDAYLMLKDEIRSSRMAPGFQAPEPEIAERLGMSRTPVREALIRLEGEGLVEIVPRRGARVLPVGAQDMLEIYDILAALEPDAAARFAKTSPSDKTLQPLDDAMRDMEKAVLANDADAWAEADDRFHLTLLDLQGNRRLKAVVIALYEQAHRARVITLRFRGIPPKSTHEHREILEFLRAADAEGVRRVFKVHRDRAAKELLFFLQDCKLGQV